MLQEIKNRLIGVKPQASRAEVMASRPLRNPLIVWERVPLKSSVATVSKEAQTESGETTEAQAVEETETVGKKAGVTVMLLKVPRRKDKLGNAIARVFRLPDFRKLELDEIGSDVWEMCDGTTTVDALTRAICTKWRMNRRQGETSVTAYLRMLAERRLIMVRKGTAAAPKGAKNKSVKSVKGRASSSPARKQKQA